MNPLLYGLKVDFVRSNGHYMVLSAPDEGLRKEHLATFQVNMLIANKIPHLLALQVEERNDQVYLYYPISDKKMLAHWLRMGNISLKQFYSLLYAIVDTISQSNIYMLQEGCYVLKEDYIYCGEQITDVHLTYLPKEVLPDKSPLAVDLQQLASRLIHKVSELSGSGYQELMSYLMEESFTITGCKQLLQKHRNRLEASAGQQESVLNSRISQAAGSTATIPTPEPLFTAAADTAVKQPEPSLTPPAFSPSWFEEDDQKELAKQGQKLRMPVLLVCFLVLVLIWKLYLDHSSEGWLLICGGLSLLVVDIVYVILQIWKPAAKDSEAVTWADVHQNLSKERQQHPNSAPLLPFFTPQTAKAPLFNGYGPGTEAAAFEESDFESRLDSRSDSRSDPRLESRSESRLDRLGQDTTEAKTPESYYSGLEQRTTLLAPMDATVLLDGSMLQLDKQRAQPYLEVSINGAKNTIHISKSPFVIGREGQGVDYVHKETGTSRIHAEITRENEQTAIKDLGSRNGTFINGEILVPYRMYNLQEGDIVKIISTEFVCKMGLLA
ncbi:DUF6382 domain-containing protein [Paenibacillus agricola]|uniref:FHA domain-containing protein n=1 Tax=Paenibacillus agricola TaxID=2716264 RepID=A0ABX0J4Y3_9BACL|nr:DUF6382 domain-containing protein [Paenibacillus agricola]NHN30708.1 FHA domain-containing protein [Paenibacillus agricola]